MPDLKHHSISLDDALAAARAAPLSKQKALLAALLLDDAVDRLFEQSNEDDPLAFRARLAAQSEPLSQILALAAGHLALVTEAVEVPLADYPALPVEDFMVSLYNAHTVMRVRIALPDGGRRDVHEVLERALAALP